MGRWQCRSSCGQGPYCGFNSCLFYSPSPVSCVMLEEEPTPASGVHPPPPLGGSGGPLAVTPCAWSDPRPLPQHGSSSPQPGNLTSYCPKGLGEHKVGQGRDPGRKGWPLPPEGGRGEHPRSLVPAALIGTPCPIYFTFLPSPPSVVFLCQLCRFYFIPFFFPFHREIKV